MINKTINGFLWELIDDLFSRCSIGGPLKNVATYHFERSTVVISRRTLKFCSTSSGNRRRIGAYPSDNSRHLYSPTIAVTFHIRCDHNSRVGVSPLDSSFSGLKYGKLVRHPVCAQFSAVPVHLGVLNWHPSIGPCFVHLGKVKFRRWLLKLRR